MLAPTGTGFAITVDRLVKVYKTVTAVDGISFELERGSCTALLGGNGAGKTTTISTIMGLVEPTSGRVTVLGAVMPRQRHLCCGQRTIHGIEEVARKDPRRAELFQQVVVVVAGGHRH